MLINLQDIIQKYSMNIRGIIHVGAHWGEEYDDYSKAGINRIIFIEPCDMAFQVLQERFKNNKDVFLSNFACGNPKEMLEMVKINVELTNQGQSNSILKANKHLEHYPNITFDETEEIKLCKLDDLIMGIFFSKKDFIDEDYNLLMMDVQGYELEVLKGSTQTLEFVDYIYTEVNTDELYEGCAKLEDMDAFLNEKGFIRVETTMTNKNWGDSLYIKK